MHAAFHANLPQIYQQSPSLPECPVCISTVACHMHLNQETALSQLHDYTKMQGSWGGGGGGLRDIKFY